MSRPPERLLLLAFVTITGMYVLSPVVDVGDGRNGPPTAVSIVNDGDLDLDEFRDLPWHGEYQTVTSGGSSYDFFPWTRSIVVVPAAAALDAAEMLGVGDGAAAAIRNSRTERILLVGPAAATTAAAAIAAGLIAWYSTRSKHRTWVMLVVIGGTAFGTGYWSTSSRGVWQHGPATLWFSLAIVAALLLPKTRRQWPAAAVIGAAATAAAFTRPTYAILGIAVATWVAWKHPRQLLAAGIGSLAVGIPVMVVNWATFGSAMMPYYDASRATDKKASVSFVEGLAGSLISPSRGVLVFMPAIVLAACFGLWVARRDRLEMSLRSLLATAAIVHFLFMANSPEGWWAGHSFGARFAVDLVPIAVLLAVPAVDEVVRQGVGRPIGAVLTTALLWSVVVHAQGATVREASCWNSRPVDIDQDPSRVWDLEDAQVYVGAEWVITGHSPLTDSCGEVASGVAA